MENPSPDSANYLRSEVAIVQGDDGIEACVELTWCGETERFPPTLVHAHAIALFDAAYRIEYQNPLLPLSEGLHWTGDRLAIGWWFDTPVMLELSNVKNAALGLLQTAMETKPVLFLYHFLSNSGCDMTEIATVIRKYQFG